MFESRYQLTKRRKPRGIPWGWAIVLSLFVHLLIIREVSRVAPSDEDRQARSRQDDDVKVRILEPEEARRLVEAAQKPTRKKPEQAQHLGPQDHATDQETRVDVTNLDQRGLDPAIRAGRLEQGAPTPPPAPEAPQAHQADRKEPSVEPSDSAKKTTGPGPRQKTAEQKTPPKKESYSSWLPNASDLSRYMEGGRVDILDDSIAVGDVVDINTSEYRFIGYFTSMRKSIELAWVYPYEAAVRGMQGTVGLEFTITKDGSTQQIRVVNTSGYRLLDDAIVKAIREASPFQPLPDNFGKDSLTVRGNFIYTMNNYIR